MPRGLTDHDEVAEVALRLRGSKATSNLTRKPLGNACKCAYATLIERQARTRNRSNSYLAEVTLTSWSSIRSLR